MFINVPGTIQTKAKTAMVNIVIVLLRMLIHSTLALALEFNHLVTVVPNLLLVSEKVNIKLSNRFVADPQPRMPMIGI